MAYRDDYLTLTRLRDPEGLSRFCLALRRDVLENLRREAIDQEATVSSLIRETIEAKFANRGGMRKRADRKATAA